MKVEVYSLYDSMIERHLTPPMFVRDEKEAIASVNRAGLPVPILQSVTLFKVGEFDDKTGELIPCVLTRVCNFLQEEKTDAERSD